MPDALKVLILEDSPEDAAHIVEQLRADGFEPQWTRVETRDEYVARLDEAWDLVIADFMLPGFDGLAALRLLRERGLETPYIIVTGVLDDLVAAECLQQGANDFLLKDRLRRLGAAVRNALEQGRLREEGRRAAAIAVESEAKRLAYLVAVPDLMVRVRSDGALLDYWASEDSPAVLPLDRIPGSRVDEVLPSNIARDFMRCAKASLETGKRQAFEFELQRPEGLRHFEARLGHSTKNEAIATIRDVTDRYRAQQEVARLAEENAILASIGRTVTSSLDFDEVLAQVAEQTRGLISFDVLAINLLEPDGATLRMAYTAGVEAKFDWRRGRTIPLAGTVSENVLQEGRGIAFHPKERADMADRYPRSLQAFTAGYRSFLVVPLTGRDEARGTLVFLSKQKAAFGGRDLEVAGRIANKISGVLANSRLYEERRRAEERLRESEERYRALVENLDARVSLKGADGRYMLANQRFMDYVGRPDGVAGMTVRDLSFSPATSDALASRDAEVFRTGKTLRFKETLPSEHGPQTFLVRKAPVRDSDGQVSAVVTVSTDITELHESQAQARRLARESELLAEIGRTVSSAPGVGDVFERFSELLGELVPLDGVGVIVVEPADGRVVLTNLHTEGGRLPWEQGVAYEVEGTFSQAVAREGRPLRFSTASRSTLKRRYPGSLPSFEAGYRSFAGAPLLTKGEAFGALTLISQELDAYDDAHLMLLERVAAQISGPIANARLYEERVRTETELAALFEAVAHPIVVSDRTGTIVRVNSEATAAFGYREEELLGSPVEVLLPERYRSRHPQRVADWFSNPTRRPMGTGRVLRAIRKDGAEFPIDLSLSPVAIGDETWCIAVVQDVTLAVEAQDALRRSEETHRRLSEENAAIAEIGRIVGSSLAMDEVYDGFGELACSLLPAERVDVVAVDLERGTLRVEYSHGDAIDAPTAQVGFERPLAGSIAEAVIARGSPVLVVPSSRDELSETFPAAAGSYDLGIRSAIFVPLASGGKPIGMITFASTEPGAFSEQELSLADHIGPHLSGALANAQLYAEHVRTEAELAALFEAVAHPIVVSDRTGTIVRVNSEATAAFGYREEELLGSPVEVLLPERYRSRHRQHLDGWFSNPTRRPMGSGRELRAMRKDGAEFPVDIWLSPGTVGDETWCIAVVQDVTLAVEAQDALRRSEETHRRLSEENAAIAEIGRIIGSSLAMDEVYDGFGELACSLLPAERVDVVAVDLEQGALRVEYSHGKAIDAPTAQVGFERPLAGSIAEAVIARGSPVLVVPSSRDELSETFPAAAGSYDLGIRSAIFVPLASGGKPIGMITFASTEPGAFSEQELSLADRIGGHLSGALANTQLYAQGEAARREMARLAQAVESTHDAVFITDMGGRINYVDSAASALTGYGHSELIGSHLVDMMPESDARLYDEIADSVKISGEWRGETTLQSRSGETLDVRISAAPVKDEQGRPSGMVATATDIRAEKRSEAALREVSRLASVGELAAGVAHELNNPLASIVGFAELLSAGDMDEQVRRDIGKIQSNAQRASRIVQDLLYFARRHEPARAPVDIVQIVRRAVELKRYDFERAGISVSVDSSRGLPEVQGDEHQLIQVVLNLLTNAAQAIGEVSPEGRVDITVAHESERIRITVADNGPGIPSEIRGRLFDPFFTTKEVGKGTGLGLSLSLGIVLQHGGRLWVESETGAGATFHVDLPTTDGAAVSAVEPAVADGVQPERARGPDATAARGMDVLVVDDESDVREMVRRHLLSTGIRVDSADGGNQAWMLLKEKTYDAIVTDLLMPEMDGRELYERIEKTDKAIARRVVFMTGDTLSPDTRRFLKDTGRQALGKPFTGDDLLRAVREVQENQHDRP